MARQIKSRSRNNTIEGTPVFSGPTNSDASNDYDSYKDRLIKYIPGEIISLYLCVSVILESNKSLDYFETTYWILFGILLLGTILYLKLIMSVSSAIQLVISCGAFTIWVYTLGGPFKYLNFYNPIYGALLLPIYTFFVALVKVNKE